MTTSTNNPAVHPVHQGGSGKTPGMGLSKANYATMPIPDQAPSTYGATPIDRCKTLYEEYRMAANIDFAAGQALLKVIVKKFDATSFKELNEAHLKEIQQGFMKMLRKIYIEQGKEGALTF